MGAELAWVLTIYGKKSLQLLGVKQDETMFMSILSMGDPHVLEQEQISSGFQAVAEYLFCEEPSPVVRMDLVKNVTHDYDIDARSIELSTESVFILECSFLCNLFSDAIGICNCSDAISASL